MFFKNEELSWKKVLINSFMMYCFVILITIIYLFFISKDLPSLDELQKFNPQQVSKIISAEPSTV